MDLTYKRGACVALMAVFVLLTSDALKGHAESGVACQRDRPTSREQQQEAQAVMPQSVIQFQEGLLSVQIRDAPWAEVLHTLERQAGLTIQVKGQLAGTVSLEFEALPLEQGLRRLFRDADALLVHTPGTQEGGTPQIMIRVWSFSKEGATAPSENAKPRVARGDGR